MLWSLGVLQPRLQAASTDWAPYPRGSSLHAPRLVEVEALLGARVPFCLGLGLHTFRSTI